MHRSRTVIFPITASAVIANQSSTPQPVQIDNVVLTETGGSTNVTVEIYVPAVTGDGTHPVVASASGTLVGTITVPKGTTLVLPHLHWWFPAGVYLAVSGGTLAGTLGIS